MRRNKAADNTASLPAMTNAETPGYYTDATPGTLITADEMNIIQEELVAIATMKGASLDNAGTNLDQCAEALDAVLAIETDVASVSNTTCVNKRMIAVSSGATATGNHSAVIASKKTTTNNAASGAQSAVIACDESVASGDESATLASTSGTASGTSSAVIASKATTVSGGWSAAIASSGVTGTSVTGDACASVSADDNSVAGTYNASVASVGGTVGGATTANMNVEIASNGCTTGAAGGGVYRAATIASDGCDNNGVNNCAIIGSKDCDIPSGGGFTEVVMLAAELVDANDAGASVSDGDVIGGTNGALGAPTWRIDGGLGEFNGGGTYNGSGVDYAEMFPNADGVAHAPGRILSRLGRACRLAQPGDRVLGIVSVRPTVCGGVDAVGWAHRYQIDKWGARVMVEHHKREIVRDGKQIFRGMADDAPETEEGDEVRDWTVTLPAINPAHERGRKHTPRRDRPAEWTCVGLVGQLRIAIDATVTAETEFIAPGADGVGTHSDEESRGACIELMEIVEPYDEAEGYGVALVFIR